MVYVVVRFWLLTRICSLHGPHQPTRRMCRPGGDRTYDQGGALRLLSAIGAEGPAGVPFDVFLYRFLPAAAVPGYFQIRHIVEGDLEQTREARIREACARKIPNLGEWRRSSGARTVLILEDNDLQLTNPQRVFDVLIQIESTIADKADEVHLVSTMIENPWFIHALRIDVRDYYQLSEARQCMTEIDPRTLTDLTGR